MMDQKLSEPSLERLYFQRRYGALAWRLRSFISVVVLGTMASTIAIVKERKHCLDEATIAERERMHTRNTVMRTLDNLPATNQRITQDRTNYLQRYKTLDLYEIAFLPLFHQFPLETLARQDVLQTLEQIRQQMPTFLQNQSDYTNLVHHMHDHPQAYCGTESYIPNEVLFMYINNALCTSAASERVVTPELAIQLAQKNMLALSIVNRFPGALAHYMHRLIREGQRNGDVRALLLHAFADEVWSDSAGHRALLALDTEERAIVDRILCEASEEHQCRNWRRAIIHSQ